MNESELSSEAIENQFALIENIKANMVEDYFFLDGQRSYDAWLRDAIRLRAEPFNHLLHLRLIALLIRADSQMRMKIVKKKEDEPIVKKKKYWIF